MAKIAPLADVGSLANTTAARAVINDNSQKIEDAFANTLSRDGSAPNQMEADIDLNDHYLLNVADPVNEADGVNLRSVRPLVEEFASQIVETAVFGTQVVDTFPAATAGQADFLLTQPPGSIANIEFFVDGLALVPGVDFTLSGAALQTLTLVTPLVGGELTFARYSKALPSDIALADNVTYTPPSTGVGGTVRSFLDALWANTGSSLIRFLQKGTGARARTTEAKLQERVSVLDFIPTAEHAAIGDYTTTYDATTDLQNAIDSMPAGGCLHFPEGLYRVSAALVVSNPGITLEGDTPWKCALQQTNLNLGILTLASTANNTNVRNLRFAYVAGTPTGGFAIDSQGGYNHIDNIVISQCFGGVKLSVGAGQKLTHFDIFNYESIGVLCEAINDILISDFIMNAGTIARGQLGGIRLNNKAEAIMVNRGDILLGKYSLTTDATLYSIGVRPAYCNFTDVFFDSSERGSVIDKMIESEFVGCWFSGGRTAPGYPGLTLSQTDSLKFTNTRFFNNGSHGLSVTSTTKRLGMVNCSANSNSVTTGAAVAHGLFFGANVTDFAITGCTSTNGLYTGTQGYGIYLTAGCDNFAIRDNMVSGNATGAINDLASAATQKYISGNIGYRTNQNYTVTVAVGTSSTVVPHGLPFTPSASDFSMAPVGSPAASSVSTYWISALGATNFTVNTNAAVAGTPFNIAITIRSKGA